jgi:hypothetical protein
MPNAFLCRKSWRRVASNGNDLVGLASIKTLRSADMIARETILEVVKCVDEGNVRPNLERRCVSAGFRAEELSFH